MGTSVAMFLSPEAVRNTFKREKEVRK